MITIRNNALYGHTPPSGLVTQPSLCSKSHQALIRLTLASVSCLIRKLLPASLLAVLFLHPTILLAADIALQTSSNTTQGTTAFASSAEAQTQINTLIAALIAAHPGATQSGNTVQWREDSFDVQRKMERAFTIRVGWKIDFVWAPTNSFNTAEEKNAMVPMYPAALLRDAPYSAGSTPPQGYVYSGYLPVPDTGQAAADALLAGIAKLSSLVAISPAAFIELTFINYLTPTGSQYPEYNNSSTWKIVIQDIHGHAVYDNGYIQDGDSLIVTYEAWSAGKTGRYIDYKDTVSYCPAGYTLSGSTCTLPPDIPDPQKNNDEPDCGVGNPCNAGTGNKYQSEVDYAGSGIYPLLLERVYNSGSTTPSSVETTVWGSRWRGVYDRSIAYATNGTISTATAKREGGKQYYFNLSGASFVGDADVVGKLVRVGVDANGNATGWTYTNKNDEIESYNASGRLISLANRTGQIQALTYSDGTTGANGGYVLDATGANTTTILPAGRLIRITDLASRRLQYGYDVAGRVVKATDPAGGVTTYAYSDATSTANLTAVTYPDGKIRTHLYNEAANVSSTPNAGVSYVNSLTGMLDENGNRFASWTYDAAGRATSSEHGSFGSGIDHIGLTYTAPDASGNSTTNVTDSRGAVRTYNFATILGVVKSAGQSQPGGSGSLASASALTYDANGNVASRTDFNGNKTTYSYDMARNLEASRTEGLNTAGNATPATRTITTTWHPTWRLPLVTSEYNGATATGTDLRRTTNVYDTKGNITSITVADPVRNLTRTTTITYTYSSVVPGLVLSKVVDGPRTDVNDITTYNYYDANATCTASSAAPFIDPITNTSPDNLGCRGQLLSKTNALGQTTTYGRYNHHGQVEQMTNANGLVTTSTYDLRQRLLSRTVGTQTTSLTYDNAGQVIRLTMPDTSQLNYTYDAAHRLTEVQDILGNKVTYTLDSEGNRINEATTDPLGNLAKTITRSYDALNRLQQVTGVE